MGQLRRLEDRDAIEKWLRRDAAVHLYEIGDLDDFFWPHTTWYALDGATTKRGPAGADGNGRHNGNDNDNDNTVAIALLYTATELPVLLIMGRETEHVHARAILDELRPVLPTRFYAHLVPGIARGLGAAWTTEQHGLHDRMILVDRSHVDAVDTSSTEPLGPEHGDEIRAFFERAYPGNWFDPRMLETQTYFGIRAGSDADAGSDGGNGVLREGELMSLAGVHVVSRTHHVAALGNIATDPSMRGRGLARIVTSAVCKRLLDEGINPIGLNVESANSSAIAVYRKLGFEWVASYEEFACAAVVPPPTA